MRAIEFIAERKVPPIKDQIIAAVKKDGGNLDDYFVRFTMNDKLGFNNRQWFPKTPDVDDPKFDVDYIGHKGGRRALWFYPLKTYLEGGHLYAKEQPYVWLVKLKPNAWLQTVKRGDNKLEKAPDGKERVGIVRMSDPPAAIFFKPAYELVGKYYDYAGRHKRHGLVKGPPPPVKSKPKSFLQKMKDKFFTEAPLPPDWDKEQLNLRQTFKNRIKYAVSKAQKLGTGSSRVAFIIPYEGRNTVLKVAKNLKGLAQNEAEIQVLDDWVIGKSDIVIPLIDYDKENKRPVWLQTEMANKIAMRPLVQMLRTPALWFLTDAVMSRLALPRTPEYINTPQKIKQKYFDKSMWSSLGGTPTESGFEIFQEYVDKLAELKDSSDIELGDLQTAANWGQFMGRPVVIDLGLSSEVWGKYYLLK